MARPKGSFTRPQLRDYLGKDNIEKLTNKALKLANAGDVVMLRFLLEQVYGKAVQPISGENGKAITIKFDNSFKENV